MTYVLVWVDDIIVECRRQDKVVKMSGRCFERLKMDALVASSWFLGMQLKQSPGTLTMNQSRYIDDCLEGFGVADCKPVGTPEGFSSQLWKKDCSEAMSTGAASMKAED